MYISTRKGLQESGAYLSIMMTCLQEGGVYLSTKMTCLQEGGVYIGTLQIYKQI